MMKSYTSLLAALIAAFAAGCAAPAGPSAPAPSASLSPSPTPAPSAVASTPVAAPALTGMVYDDDLAPLAGVTITAAAASGTPVTATSDANGRYALTLAEAGIYTVKATKDGLVEREQTVSVSGSTTLDFGGQTTEGGNPYFMTGAPEIRRVTLDEAGPTGPVTLTFELSEPLTEASRQSFMDRFEFMRGVSERFLRTGAAPEPYLRSTATWDAEGRIFTFKYDVPYLAGATYTARLRQRALDTLDPVTNRTAYENMGIVDAQGQALGLGRADYAFLRPRLETMAFRDLADKDFGHTPAIRRWNLTHTSAFTFTAQADTVAPGVVSARVNREQPIGGGTFDVMELRFTEPMRVVRAIDEEHYTQLKRENELVVLNVSREEDGRNPTSLSSAIVTDVKFSRTEPNVVYFYFPTDTFKDQKWVEVTLGPDMKDPAGNRPDPAKNRVAGQVG